MADYFYSLEFTARMYAHPATRDKLIALRNEENA